MLINIETQVHSWNLGIYKVISIYKVKGILFEYCFYKKMLLTSHHGISGNLFHF